MEVEAQDLNPPVDQHRARGVNDGQERVTHVWWRHDFLGAGSVRQMGGEGEVPAREALVEDREERFAALAKDARAD